MQEFVLLGLVMILALGAYWSLVIFPRQRDFSKRQRYIRTLKPGDEMITYGGIIGIVQQVNADEGIAYVEIADGIRVRVLMAALVRPYDADEIADSARRAGSESAEQSEIEPHIAP